MSKSRRLLVGILSFLPCILLVVYCIVFFSFILNIVRHAQQEDVIPAMVLDNIAWIAGIALFMGLSFFGLLIYFIVHAINNKMVDSAERLVWILIFIFAGMVGFPVYWYMRIWKDLPDQPA